MTISKHHSRVRDLFWDGLLFWVVSAAYCVASDLSSDLTHLRSLLARLQNQFSGHSVSKMAAACRSCCATYTLFASPTVQNKPGDPVRRGQSVARAPVADQDLPGSGTSQSERAAWHVKHFHSSCREVQLWTRRVLAVFAPDAPWPMSEFKDRARHAGSVDPFSKSGCGVDGGPFISSTALISTWSSPVHFPPGFLFAAHEAAFDDLHSRHRESAL